MQYSRKKTILRKFMKEKIPVKIISEKREFGQEKAYLRRDRSGERISARSVGSW
jgi:hypothetical protein